MEGLTAKVSEYRKQCLYVGRGHYIAGEACARLHRMFGIPIVVGSTALATSVFSRWDSQGNIAWKTAVGAIAALLAVFAALQTFLRFSERAESHKTAGVNYGLARRRLELLSVQFDSGREQAFHQEFGAIIDQIGYLAASSPHLPAKYYQQARNEQLKDAS